MSFTMDNDLEIIGQMNVQALFKNIRAIVRFIHRDQDEIAKRNNIIFSEIEGEEVLEEESSDEEVNLGKVKTTRVEAQGILDAGDGEDIEDTQENRDQLIRVLGQYQFTALQYGLEELPKLKYADEDLCDADNEMKPELKRQNTMELINSFKNEKMSKKRKMSRKKDKMSGKDKMNRKNTRRMRNLSRAVNIGETGESDVIMVLNPKESDDAEFLNAQVADAQTLQQMGITPANRRLAAETEENVMLSIVFTLVLMILFFVIRFTLKSSGSQKSVNRKISHRRDSDLFCDMV